MAGWVCLGWGSPVLGRSGGVFSGLLGLAGDVGSGLGC